MPGQWIPDMSEQDVSLIEETLRQLKREIFAQIGKWALGIMGTCIVLAAVAAMNWSGLISRIEKLEIWKQDRVRPIEEYYEAEKITAERFAKIEARIEEIYRLLKQQ